MSHSFSGLLASPANLQLIPMMAMGSVAHSEPTCALPMVQKFGVLANVGDEMLIGCGIDFD